MYAQVTDAISEYRAEYAHTDGAVFLHPESERKLRSELRGRMNVADGLPVDIIEDQGVDREDVVVLPKSVRDFHDDDLRQENPTHHHIGMVLQSIEQKPLDRPSESMLRSGVMMEVVSTTMKFEYDKIRELDLTVPELADVSQNVIADPESVDMENIDTEVYEDGETPMWEMEFDWDEPRIQRIPIAFIGFGNVEQEQAIEVMSDRVLDAIGDTMNPKIEGYRYEKIDADGMTVGTVDSPADVTEADFNAERVTYPVGEKFVELGRLHMRNPDFVEVNQ